MSSRPCLLICKPSPCFTKFLIVSHGGIWWQYQGQALGHMHFYVTSKKHYYQKSWIKLKNPQLNYFLKHLSIQDNAIMWTLVCERPYNSMRIELGWMILQQSRKKYNYLIRGDCLGFVSYSSFRAKIIFSIHVPSLLLVKAWQHYVNIHLHYSQNKKTCIYLRYLRGIISL